MRSRLERALTRVLEPDRREGSEDQSERAAANVAISISPRFLAPGRDAEFQPGRRAIEIRRALPILRFETANVGVRKRHRAASGHFERYPLLGPGDSAGTQKPETP